MNRIDTIIIGAGQAGLALSRCLSALRVEHVLLERGRVAERWRSGHWDSLRLLTPNWQSRLPGFRYDGTDPHGYMKAAEVAAYLGRYAESFAAPVQTDTSVIAVEADALGFEVTTDRGVWRARSVVIATGYCDVGAVPAIARQLPADVVQVTTSAYRRPSQLPEGGVLVVGAAASGVQIADELQRAGRAVTLAVGKHTRLPRVYRGADIMHWLDRMGVLEQRTEDVPNLQAALDQPSLQLVGRPDRGSVDLGTLQRAGVQLVGRALGVDGGRMRFADDLAETAAAADRKLARTLDRIDAYAAVAYGAAGHERCERPAPLAIDRAPTAVNLHRAGIRSVVWATGYARTYPWLKVPALGHDGELRQHGGVCAYPGLYALGLRFQRRRKSSFIDGVGDDARELAAHISAVLGHKTRAPARAAA